MAPSLNLTTTTMSNPNTNALLSFLRNGTSDRGTTAAGFRTVYLGQDNLPVSILDIVPITDPTWKKSCASIWRISVYLILPLLWQTNCILIQPVPLLKLQHLRIILWLRCLTYLLWLVVHSSRVTVMKLRYLIPWTLPTALRIYHFCGSAAHWMGHYSVVPIRASDDLPLKHTLRGIHGAHIEQAHCCR